MADLSIGGDLDPTTRDRTGTATTLATADLTTHGVIVGMTGSGKTGLGIVLLEESLGAGVPALVIDPKGDLTNLCLTFPNLAPADFLPWVNEADVAKAGTDSATFAAQQATTWQEGLAGWQIAPDRIAALRSAVAFTVYTPGSAAGRGLNVVGSLSAPPDGTLAEDVADEIESYVTSLLSLLGLDADPLASREHVLLSSLIQNSWSQGRDLDLTTLLAQVQQPPMRKLGVLDLEQFFPSADRAAFAVRLNNLLASPGFASWLDGDPIDIDAMLHTPDGRPRCAIVTTAHLSDDERQSVTALVLAKLVTWMRRQSGTPDLRALLYMDEVAGYLPPTANPPTKKPILLLLKQGRAFGVGVVLSTQNPVDVDYKALSNANTWLIGRLQTEQDKARLVDGLRSASGAVDIDALGDTISTLGKRQFVLKRATSDRPTLTTTRWAMSYLRGPLTRAEVGRLAELGLVDEPSADTVATAADAAPAPPTPADDETPVAPAVAAGVAVSHVDPSAPWLAAIGAGSGPRLQAAVAARVHLRYDDAKADLVHDEEYEAILFPATASADPAEFISIDYDERDFAPAAPPGATYVLPPAELGRKSWWSSLRTSLTDHLVRSRTVQILANADLRLYSRVGEAPEDFATRCALAADERADAEIAALQRKYESKLRTLSTRAASAATAAGQAAARHEVEHGAAAQVTTLLGGIFGGRRSRSSILTEAKRATASEHRVAAAHEKAAAADRAVLDLEEELRAEVAAIDEEWRSKATSVVPLEIPLERTDVKVADLRLVWVPAS